MTAIRQSTFDQSVARLRSKFTNQRDASEAVRAFSEGWEVLRDDDPRFNADPFADIANAVRREFGLPIPSEPPSVQRAASKPSSAALDERTKAIRVAHLDLTLAQAQNIARKQLTEEGVEVPAMSMDQFSALSKAEQSAVSVAIDAGDLPALDIPDEVLTAAQKAVRGMDLTYKEQIEVFGPILAAQADRHADSKLTRERAPYADQRGEDIKRATERGLTTEQAEARHPWSDYVPMAATKRSTSDLKVQMAGLSRADMGLTSDES